MTNTTDNQQLSAEDEAMLEQALKEAQAISDQITKESGEFEKKFEDFKEKANAGLERIEKLDKELQSAEEETANELDRLIMEQAEDLASED